MKTLLTEAVETDKLSNADGTRQELEFGLHQTRYLAATQRAEDLQCPLDGSTPSSSTLSATSTTSQVPSTTTTARAASTTTTTQATSGIGLEGYLPPGTILVRGPMKSTAWGYPEEIYVYWTPRMNVRGLYNWFKQSPIFGSSLGQYNWCRALPGVDGPAVDLGFNFTWRLSSDPTSGFGIEAPSTYLKDRNGIEGGVQGIHFSLDKVTHGMGAPDFCK